MLAGTPILTAAEMRAAEMATCVDGVTLAELMQRAGAALADLAWRIAAGRPIHILCGPGNNGGDGAVAARMLAKRGGDVRVSALSEPKTELARAARRAWGGPVGGLAEDAMPGAILVDCLFGTGLVRAIAPDVASALARHAAAAHRTLAADLPSGMNSDDGALLGCPYLADVTLAFGALKPAHLLFPAAAQCGEVRLARIGMEATSQVRVAAMPELAKPDHASHKYTRGLVAVVAGAMSGAAELAARAALRSGAGTVHIHGGRLPASAPFAVVRRPWRDGEALCDPRINAIVIGPGLGQGEAAVVRFAAALASAKPLVIDADALALLPPHPLKVPTILTPHAGEFARLCNHSGDKLAATRALAERTQAVVIHKGADTVIAAPDGRVAVHSPGSPWLSCAGTGDVLAGICGAMLARGLDAFDAAQAAILLHSRAAKRAGPGLIADDLVAAPIWP
ncbi:MAG: NAD(P)H-hydrate dehydratase [Sphingopyxis sp.]